MNEDRPAGVGTPRVALPDFGPPLVMSELPPISTVRWRVVRAHTGPGACEPKFYAATVSRSGVHHGFARRPAVPPRFTVISTCVVRVLCSRQDLGRSSLPCPCRRRHLRRPTHTNVARLFSCSSAAAPLIAQWFYQHVSGGWVPFANLDSDALERAHTARGDPATPQARGYRGADSAGCDHRRRPL